MSLAEFKPLPLPKLGGLFTFLKPLDVPSGYSPNLQNVRFLPRAVLTRSGLSARMTKVGQSFNGIVQFINNIGSKTLITIDSSGNLDFQDAATGNPDTLMTNVSTAGSFLHSRTAFGRIFLSMFNPDLSPAGPIRQWNGVRQAVAPQAPLAVITVVDSATADANWAAGANTYKVQVLFETIDGCVLVASQVATWNSAGGFQPTVTGIPVGASQFNVVARWICVSLPAGTVVFRFPQFRIADNFTTSSTLIGVSATATGMEAAGSNTSQLTSGAVNAPPLTHLSVDGPAGAPAAVDSVNAGSIPVGVHQVWVSFETIFGYTTSPSPAGQWTAAGGKKVVVSTIAVGPWYVSARRLFFSSSGGQDALFVSTFRIPNNTSTSAEIDFTDINILQGTNVNYLFKNFAAPPAIACTTYGLRLVYWGALNTLKATTGVNNSSVANLGFDGGWDLVNGPPLGWVAGGAFAGGDKEQFNCFAGDAYRITADGATAVRGEIQNAFLQASGMLATGVTYTVSFRARGDAGFNAGGKLAVDLFSASSGTANLGRVEVSLSALTSQWLEYTGTFTALAAIPSDTRLRVFADGTPAPSGKSAWIDHIQIYPTLSKTETSILRISNPADVETFDGTNGLQSVAKDNGEQITVASQLRSFLYVMKERSMHVTYDDTINPPSLWIQRQIDSTIGCGSPRALVSSDTFIAFSSRGGGYMFTGARPQKVSQEIQTTWNAIDWSASGSTHTLLDTQAKVVSFFLPLNLGDTAPKGALVMDYSEGLGQEDDPGPRKWGKDLYTAPITGSLKFENSSVTQTLFGATPNTQSIYLCGGKVYENVGLDDDGVAIDWFYETAFLKAGDVGQDLFGGTTFFAEGSGQLTATLIGLDDVIQQTLQVQNLTATPGQQFELYANEETEKARLRFEGVVDKSFATIKGVTIFSKGWAAQRIH